MEEIFGLGGEGNLSFADQEKRNRFSIPCGLCNIPLSPFPHAVLKMLSEECIELLFNFCCLCARDCFCPFSVLRCFCWADMMRFFHHSSVNTSSAILHMPKGFSSLFFAEFSGPSFFFTSPARMDNFPLIPISLFFDMCQRLSRIFCHCVPIQDPPKATAAKYAGCLFSQCSTSILVIHG